MYSLRGLISGWDNFFFAAKPTEGIAFFRITWCSLLLLVFLADFQNVNDFYGPHALLSLKTVREQFPYLHANVFHLLNAGYETAYTILAVHLLALLSALFGFYTRTSLTIVLICLTSLHQRNIWLLSSSELLMRTITLLLICSPCGHSLSIDSLLGRKFSSFSKPREWAPWALRLIQIQISVVYLWTVWHKLKGDTWFDGTALYHATRVESMTNFPVPFLLDSMVFIKLATWGTLIIEVLLGIGVWFKEIRKPVILSGIIFHLGIEYMMSIPFFEWIMIALLLNFFTPEEYRVFLTALREKMVKAFNESTLQPSLKEKLVWAVRGNNE